MINVIPVLSTILPIIASSLLILVFTIHFYIRIRRKFPKSVNCWFCNTWTKVPYDDRNGFDCPNCLQYNGFNKDGGYNKIIPEQHDELMNKSTNIKTNKAVVSNGLCALCNNNQQLKIFQLANFVPLVEENYDVEIEHFQEQLEKAYKLCRKCDRVLKKTLDVQNAWLFGNHIKNICSNGLSSLHKFTDNIKKGARRSILSKLNGFFSLILVLTVIFIIGCSIKFITKNVSKFVPTAYLPIFKSIIALVNSTKVVKIDVLSPHFTQNINVEPYIMVCCMGLLLQTIAIIWEKYSGTIKINRLFCWVILLLASWVHFNKNYSTYILVVELFCCIYLLCTSFNKNQDKKQTQKFTGMRKIVKNLEYTCSDISDMSDLEDLSRTTSDSSDYMNKSTYSNQSQLTNHVPLLNYNFHYGPTNCNFAPAKHNFQQLDTDLNRSLNNLHLGAPTRPGSVFSVTSLKRPKPVLSPPKLQTINSWVAGGFWRNSDGFIMPVAQRTNLSRSSSESSGFGSQHNDNRNLFVDFDKGSAHSDLTQLKNSNYLLSPVYGGQELRKTPNSLYPNFQQNMMLAQGRGLFQNYLTKYDEPYQRKNLFENWSDKINSQATQSFKDLSLQSSNMFRN